MSFSLIGGAHSAILIPQLDLTCCFQAEEREGKRERRKGKEGQAGRGENTTGYQLS